MHCVDSLKLVNGSELADGPELKHVDKDKKCPNIAFKYRYYFPE